MTTLTLPRLGETMEEGRVVAWAVAPGERFRRGQTLLDVETDKTVVEVPALTDGVLVRTLVGPGETVAVDAPIAEVEAEGEAKPRAAPGARRMARQMGVTLAGLQGTGRLGRITRGDVESSLPREAGEGEGQGGGAGAKLRRPHPSPPPPRGGGSNRAGENLFIPVPTGRLHYRVWPGTGDPILLVHGFTGDLLSWAGLAHALHQAGRTVVALDLPGHGLTEAAGDTPEALAEAVVAAMAALDLRSVHLVGLSLGGALAVMVAASAADRIKDLSLIAPVGFGTEVDQAFVDGVLGAATPAALAREIAKVSVTPVAISDELLSLAVARLNEPGRKRQLRALANHLGRDGVQQVHVAPRLDSIRCPIRIAWGYDDAIIPWRHALSAPGRVALHLYRGAGHIPFWDKPDAFADLIGRTP